MLNRNTEKYPKSHQRVALCLNIVFLGPPCRRIMDHGIERLNTFQENWTAHSPLRLPALIDVISSGVMFKASMAII